MSWRTYNSTSRSSSKNVKTKRRKKGSRAMIRSKPTTSQYAKAAYYRVQKMSRYVRPEVKAFYDNQQSIAFGTTWSCTGLSEIPQGDAYNEREGISVSPMNLSVNIWMKKGATDNDATLLRIIILRGKNENLIGTTTFLTAYDGGFTSGQNPIQYFKEHDTRFQSKTLYDKTLKFESTNTINNLTSRQVKFNIKLDRHIVYDIDSMTTAPRDGGLYMLYVASNSAGSFDYLTKLTFLDS